MLIGLLGRSRPVRTTKVPPGVRVYAVGDIHGRADLLRRLIGLVAADADAAPRLQPYLIFLGDYVDRGPDSREVIDLLIGGLPRHFGAVFLKGNHEDALLRFLEAPATGAHWLSYGGDATLRSYGVPLPAEGTAEQQLTALRDRLARRLPPRHRAFLEHLRLCVSIGDYFFVHAGVRPGIPLDSQDAEDLMWIRDPFLAARTDHGKVVVHGHTIVEEPEERPNRIGIDTGAYATGRLTCLVLEGETRRFLST